MCRRSRAFKNDKKKTGKKSKRGLKGGKIQKLGYFVQKILSFGPFLPILDPPNFFFFSYLRKTLILSTFWHQPIIPRKKIDFTGRILVKLPFLPFSYCENIGFWGGGWGVLGGLGGGKRSKWTFWHFSHIIQGISMRFSPKKKNYQILTHLDPGSKEGHLKGNVHRSLTFR